MNNLVVVTEKEDDDQHSNTVEIPLNDLNESTTVSGMRIF